MISDSARQISEWAPRRALTVLPVACHFYGKAVGGTRLVDTHGNQCALIIERHAPCQLELAGATPDEKTCPLVLDIFGSSDVRTSEEAE